MKNGPAAAEAIKRTEVTEKSIEALSIQFAHMRETKGMAFSSLDALKYLRTETINKKMWKYAVQFSHEKALIGKHFRKATEIIPHRLQKFAAPVKIVTDIIGLKLMEDAVKESDELLNSPIEFDGKDFLTHRQGRFRGDVAMQKGDYGKALTHFHVSISRFNDLKDPADLMQRANILEIRGFKTDALIHLGEAKDVKEGVSLGLTTYDEYESSPEGKTLKEKDFATWVSWRAGCMCKLAGALLGTKRLDDLLESDRSQIIKNIQEVYKAGLGTAFFSTRQTELEECWEQLRHSNPELGAITD